MQAHCCCRDTQKPRVPIDYIPTQLLPRVERPINGKVFGTARVEEVSEEVPLARRHGKGDDREEESRGGIHAGDLVLGGLIGAALAIFIAGLLVVLLIG